MTTNILDLHELSPCNAPSPAPLTNRGVGKWSVLGDLHFGGSLVASAMRLSFRLVGEESIPQASHPIALLGSKKSALWGAALKQGTIFMSFIRWALSRLAAEIQYQNLVACHLDNSRKDMCNGDF